MLQSCAKSLATLFVLCLIMACGGEPKENLDEIELDLKLVRVDRQMLAAAQAMQEAPLAQHAEIFEQYLGEEKEFLAAFIGLPALAAEMRLNPERADSLLLQEFTQVLADSAMAALLDTVNAEFPANFPLVDRLTPPFKRLKLHFPDIEVPALRTHVSGYVPAQHMGQVDQIVPLPGYFSLGLHYFMGQSFPYYSPVLPEFIKRRFDPAYLEVMAMREVAEGMVAPLPRDHEATFLDQVVREGIKQYFMHQMLPRTPDSMLLLYTASQMDWANFYEARIYKSVIDQLFSSNFELKRDYLGDKPYTTTLSLESAPRLGEYLGYRIVQAYMERQDELSLAELCESQDYEKIFRESKYRP